MTQRLLSTTAAIAGTAGSILLCHSQTNIDVFSYFKQYLNLSQDQIAAIRNGQAVAANLTSRLPAEIFVFGAVYVKAPPESYLKLAYDFDRMRKLPEYLAIEKFSAPPKISDLSAFGFDSGDIKDLRDCKLDNCDMQMPASSIQTLHQTVKWSAPDAEEQVNRLARERALQLVVAYQKEGDRILGVYNDKRDPTEVPEQFKYMLSYTKALPKVLPDFYAYLLDYPRARPAKLQDMFYWARVKFGLKPTLRLVHVVTMQGSSSAEPAYTIAEKQLYSSHYFETALDLTYLVRHEDPRQTGFYLIMVMGSEQAGLTGFKGSIVRRVAVDRSVSSLQKSLASIKNTLEQE